MTAAAYGLSHATAKNWVKAPAKVEPRHQEYAGTYPPVTAARERPGRGGQGVRSPGLPRSVHFADSGKCFLFLGYETMGCPYDIASVAAGYARASGTGGSEGLERTRGKRKCDSAGIRISAPIMFQRNMNVSMMPMSA